MMLGYIFLLVALQILRAVAEAEIVSLGEGKFLRVRGGEKPVEVLNASQLSQVPILGKFNNKVVEVIKPKQPIIKLRPEIIATPRLNEIPTTVEYVAGDFRHKCTLRTEEVKLIQKPGDFHKTGDSGFEVVLKQRLTCHHHHSAAAAAK